MNLNTLAALAEAGSVRELELFSLEGGFYMLRALTTQGAYTLLDERGQTRRLRSSTELRDLLHEHGIQPLPCTLVQHVVHDEMCGRRDGPIEPLRLPVSLERQW